MFSSFKLCKWIIVDCQHQAVSALCHEQYNLPSDTRRYLTIFNNNYRQWSEFSNICMLYSYNYWWVNIWTFGRVVHIRKVLIITGTSSKIREIKRVYAFLNIQKYEIWPTNTFVHVRKFQIISDEVCTKTLRNGILTTRKK